MLVPVDKIQNFKLADTFLNDFKEKTPDWGFGVMSYITYKRTYARPLQTGGTEEWWQTCQRVIEGMFTIQKAHCKTLGLHWDNRKAQRSAQEAYIRMFEFKWLPPGRGLWAMGTDFVYERGGACLQNCGFISTETIDVDFATPFVWCFTMSMYGVGVGFDTAGEGKITLQEPRVADDSHIVGDSREGWAEALERVLTAFTGRGSLPSEWDTRGVRRKGSAINGFGGTASGPEPLIEMLRDITELLHEYVGRKVDSTLIVDLMNLAGKCVVAGGVRRTAEIGIARHDDIDFLNLKLDEEELNHHRWASNNSIFAEIGMNYEPVADRTRINGEPGYAWLSNMRRFGRLKDGPNNKDRRAKGTNPCVEQTLEDRELCCLVENFIARHDSLEDFMRTLKFSYMYAKTVTLVPTHDPLTNVVMMRNRRIGCSISGIAQNIAKLGLRGHLNWCDKGYDYIKDLDNIYSEWLCVPHSIKMTSVKPSGTVSILAGSTPGIHYGHAQFYIRRIRVADTSPIWKNCENAGYKVEDCAYHPSTKVIEFPIYDPYYERGKDDLTIWEQVNLAALHQYYWADNQVSCTVTFKEHEGDQIARVLEAYEDRLKGISFLPSRDHGYKQPPYETITKQEYEARLAVIKPMDLRMIDHETEDKFCDGEACEISFGPVQDSLDEAKKTLTTINFGK